MCWYWVHKLDDKFTGGCGGGTTVLVLCIGIESRLHTTNSMVAVMVVPPLYWYGAKASDDVYFCGGCGGGTTVLVLYIFI